MKVVSTMFPRKNIHKERWNAPNGTKNNQIDHVLIDNRHKKNICNVRSFRKAECGSDHNLVLIKIYQRLTTEKFDKSNIGTITNFEVLKNPIKANQFRSMIADKFRELEEQERTGIDTKWEYLKNTIQECAKKICGDKERKKGKPWFDQECSEQISRRKLMREIWLQTKSENDRKQYIYTNKATTKLLRQKKRTWLKSLMIRAEKDRTANNSRDFYRTSRFFRQEYKPKAYDVKDKDGRIIIQQNEGLKRWKEYFDDLLNGEVRKQAESLPKYQNV